jgi:hypothetical protein
MKAIVTLKNGKEVETSAAFARKELGNLALPNPGSPNGVWCWTSVGVRRKAAKEIGSRTQSIHCLTILP